MTRYTTPFGRRLSYTVFLGLALFVVACGGGEALLPTPAENDPPTPEPDELVFGVPQNGSTLTEPGLVYVTGEDIQSVTFKVDGDTQSQDSDAPFEWTLRPDAFEEGAHLLTVDVDTPSGPESVSVNVTLAALPTGPDQPTDVFEAVKNLPEGHWLEIPNTKMNDVKPDPVPAGNFFRGITIAWSGGAFDTKRDRLIIWGGGHADYAGNEIYAFDLNTLKWSRLTDPSAFPPGDPTNSAESNKHPDGRPISRHTYEYLEYIPEPVDRFFSGGGAVLWKGGQFNDDSTWLFDFDKKEWSEKSVCPEEGIGAVCAVDANGIVWQHHKGLASYNAATDTWTRHTQNDDVYTYDMNAEVDTVNNRFIVVGGGKTIYYQLDAAQISGKTLNTTGDRSIESTGNPDGLAFHAPSSRMVMWKGGSDVYTLDVNTLVWKRVQARNSKSPGSPVVAGTYGRFRYSPKHDLFVLYNRVDENVFVYRLPKP